jgi:hypothetical protein
VLRLAQKYPDRSPESITRRELTSHLADLRKWMKPGAVAASYHNLRSFFTWLAEDADIASPARSQPGCIGSTLLREVLGRYRAIQHLAGRRKPPSTAFSPSAVLDVTLCNTHH